MNKKIISTVSLGTNITAVTKDYKNLVVPFCLSAPATTKPKFYIRTIFSAPNIAYGLMEVTTKLALIGLLAAPTVLTGAKLLNSFEEIFYPIYSIPLLSLTYLLYKLFSRLTDKLLSMPDFNHFSNYSIYKALPVFLRNNKNITMATIQRCNAKDIYYLYKDIPASRKNKEVTIKTIELVRYAKGVVISLIPNIPDILQADKQFNEFLMSSIKDDVLRVASVYEGIYRTEILYDTVETYSASASQSAMYEEVERSREEVLVGQKFIGYDYHTASKILLKLPDRIKEEVLGKIEQEHADKIKEFLKSAVIV